MAENPPSGTACAPCQLLGHFCPAFQYFDGDPVCVFCLDGEPCRRSIELRRKLARPTPPDPHAKPPAPVPQAPKLGPYAEPEPDAPKKESPTMRETKKCAKPGCTHNASGSGSYCSTRHYYLLKKERAGLEPEAPAKTRAPRRSSGFRDIPSESHNCAGDPSGHSGTQEVDESPTHAVLLALTEAQCDAIFRRCTHQQKAMALGAVLQTLLSAPEGVNG